MTVLRNGKWRHTYVTGYSVSTIDFTLHFNTSHIPPHSPVSRTLTHLPVSPTIKYKKVVEDKEQKAVPYIGALNRPLRSTVCTYLFHSACGRIDDDACSLQHTVPNYRRNGDWYIEKDFEGSDRKLTVTLFWNLAKGLRQNKKTLIQGTLRHRWHSKLAALEFELLLLLQLSQ